MALRWQALVLILGSVLFINCLPTDTNISDPNEIYRTQIWTVLDYLNSNPNREYNYNFGHFLNAQKKTDDIIAIELDVDAECLDQDTCTTLTLSCKAYVQYFPDENKYDALPGIECNKKIEDENERSTTPQVYTEQVKEEQLPEESSEVIVEEVLVPKKKPCLGCMEELNKNAEGVDALIKTAINHIEYERDRKYVSVQVLKLSSQVILGVKYSLILEIAPTICSNILEVYNQEPCVIDANSEHEFCEITFLQKPWISRIKHIIGNNCTISQEFSPPPNPKTQKNDIDNEIEVNNAYQKPEQNQNTQSENRPNFDKMAESGTLEEFLTPAKIAEIEAQLIPTDSTKTKDVGMEATKSGIDNSQLGVEDIPSVPTSTDGFYQNNQQQFTKESSSENVQSELVEEVTTETTQEDYNKEEATHSVTSEEISPSKPSVKKDESESSESSASSESTESLSKTAISRKKRQTPKRIPKQNPQSSEETNETSEEDGTIYVRKRRELNSQNTLETQDIEDFLYDAEEIQNENERIKRDASKSSEEDVLNGKTTDDKAKIEKDEKVLDASSVSSNEAPRKVRSTNHKLEEEELVKKLAEFAVESFNDPLHKNEVMEILSIKKIELEGAVYYLSLHVGVSKCSATDFCYLEHEKLCKFQLHVSKGHKFKLLKSHCHNLEKDSDKNRTNRRFKRDVLVGAPYDAKDDEEIKDLTKLTLLQIDEKSVHENKYKILEILEATQQIVAGKLYKIKAKISLSDCTKDSKKDSELCGVLKEKTPKICDIQIWDQPWLPNGRKTNATCEDENYYFTTNSRPKRGLDIQWTHGMDRNDHYKLFQKFMKEHNKFYSSRTEKLYRFKIFKHNLAIIKKLNRDEQGTALYGPTKFADLTKKEFKNYLGYRPDLRNENDIGFAQAEIPDIDLPDEFDWRKRNAVAEVKDQGQCGSCWAFSVTGNVEGQYALKYGKLVEFSEQELVDCDKTDDGCGGGLMDNAYRAIEKIGGLEGESDYPYDAEDETCHFNKSLVKVQLSGAVNISTNETDMAKWLVQNGPISIAINANAMQFYMGGVSHPVKFLCSPADLDHGVLIVGYGVYKNKFFNKTKPYWIVKNSWGTRWGEQGYYRVFRGDGTCGLNKTPSSAIVE